MKNPDDHDLERSHATPPHGVQGAGSTDWSRADFEAAVPLYVGGDLDAEEATRVERWVAAHPEDAGLVEAADAALEALREHARRFEQRATPDLWPGIRAELSRAGGAARVASVAGSLAGSAVAAQPTQGHRRWFERPVLAAAAALLLVGGLGYVLVKSGAQGGAVPGANAGRPAVDGPAARGDVVANSVLPAAIAGEGDQPLDVRMVGAKRGQAFRATGGDAEHLVDSVSPLLLWQQAPHSSDLDVPARADRDLHLTGDR